MSQICFTSTLQCPQTALPAANGMCLLRAPLLIPYVRLNTCAYEACSRVHSVCFCVGVSACACVWGLCVHEIWCVLVCISFCEERVYASMFVHVSRKKGRSYITGANVMQDKWAHFSLFALVKKYIQDLQRLMINVPQAWCWRHYISEVPFSCNSSCFIHLRVMLSLCALILYLVTWVQTSAGHIAISQDCP